MTPIGLPRQPEPQERALHWELDAADAAGYLERHHEPVTCAGITELVGRPPAGARWPTGVVPVLALCPDGSLVRVE